MNLYGLRAKEYWQKADRLRYEELEDPETFFSDLGDQVGARVESIWAAMSRDAPRDETFFEKVGRLNAIKKQAEEIAMDELVNIPAQPSTVDEELEWLEMQRPSEERIQELLERLEDEKSEMPTDDYEEEKARLLALRDPI